MPYSSTKTTFTFTLFRRKSEKRLISEHHSLSLPSSDKGSPNTTVSIFFSSIMSIKARLNNGKENKISSRIKLSVKTNDDNNKIIEKLKKIENVYDVEIENNDNLKDIIVYSNDEEPREKIYAFIKSTDWIIYEMIKERENLEEVFHTLTKGDK